MFFYPTTATLYIKQPDPTNPGFYLKDDYGRFLLEPTPVKCAVTLRENVTRDREGAEVKTFMDADFPPHIPLDYGDELEYIDDLNRVYRGALISLGENKDPLGIKTLSRYGSFG